MAAASIDRVDRGHVEPGDGLHEDQPGLRALLRGADGETAAGDGQPNYANGFAVALQPHMLDVPLAGRKPRLVFVNSMSDLFHEDVPIEFIHRVFDVMSRAHQHTFQVLDEARGAPGELRLSSALARQRLDGRHGRERRATLIGSTTLREYAGSGEVPVVGATAGTAARPRPRRHRLGDRRRRVGTRRRPMDPRGSPTSAISARVRRAVLLQAVGWNTEEGSGRTLDGRTWSEMPRTDGLTLTSLH